MTKLLMPMSLSVFAMLVVTGSAQAQCPAADSVFGRAPREFSSLKSKYDDFTDSTTVISSVFYVVPFDGDQALATITTVFAGKVPAVGDTGITLMSIRVEKQGKGGMLGGNGAALTTANAHFSDVKEVFFKFSNGSRMRVPILTNKAILEAAGAFTPQKLIETLVFKLSPVDRLTFAKGGSGEMRFGDYIMKFDEEQTERDMANTVRLLTCGQK